MPDGVGGNKEPSPLERLVAARQAEKKAQRKKDSRVLVLLVLAVLVIAGGGVASWLRIAPPSWLHHRAAHAASATPAPKVKLTTQPLSPVDTNGPPADPFSGTPADHWADGAAGIAIPAARAHGAYTAAQVRAAYETTRKLLIAGNLDWPTLRGGAPKAFKALLVKPERTDFLAALHTTAVNKDGSDKNTRGWITTFAPGSTTFVTTIVKVHGTMKAGVAAVPGGKALRITVDYLFVHVVEPPGDPADWMRVVQQISGTVDFARWDDQGSSSEPWYSASGSTAGARCDTHDGYIHPDFSTGPPSTVQASGPPLDPYSLATEAPGGGCEATTGT
jgi:hypothetical protein